MYEGNPTAYSDFPNDATVGLQYRIEFRVCLKHEGHGHASLNINCGSINIYINIYKYIYYIYKYI